MTRIVLGLALAAVAVALAVVVLSQSQTGVQRPGHSGLAGAAELRQVFAEQTRARIDTIAKCVVGEFAKRYTYDQAAKLVNDDDFRNNPAVTQVLDGCTFAILRQLYAIAARAMENKCNRDNMALAVRWLVENVEYRIHSEDEIGQILARLAERMAGTCWTDETVAKLLELSKKKFVSLARAAAGQGVADAFVAARKYDGWLTALAAQAVNTWRASGKYPADYAAMLFKISGEQIDALTDGGWTKLAAQAGLVTYLAAKWCRDTAALFAAVDPVPFEPYTADQVRALGDRILANWCWTPDALQARAHKVLGDVL